MNPRLQEILHNITTRLAALEQSQKKEWQGLTAYEIQELHLANPNWGDFACAIEAALRSKNT